MTGRAKKYSGGEFPFIRHELIEQAFSRATGASLVPGNDVRLLKDAAENYPAWQKALEGARKWIHFESYIIHEDDAGREFASILMEKARQGVKVRLMYDWLGGFGKTSRRFWRMLMESGVEVRCFNPPRIDSPFGWIARDHRKMIGIDGEVAFVTGLCVGKKWRGDPARSVEPWRDTGVEVRGPAVADIEQAFGQIWKTTGDPMPDDEVPSRGEIPTAGEVPLRVVASVPSMAGLYRLDQHIVALAQTSLWLTDAYYVGIAPYVQSLRAAAMEGVDVRLLIPGATDIPVIQAVSRAGYKPLLEGGVRIYEWNGPMIHAKTAVADGYWARVGSTNLNLASWLGNYELDVVVENENFAGKMEEMYLQDLENATEIILSRRSKVMPVSPRRRGMMPKGSGSGSVGRVGAGAIRISNTVSAAITNRRVLGPAEARITFIGGVTLLGLALAAFFIPRFVTFPLAVLSAWFGIALLIKGWKLRRKRLSEIAAYQREEAEEKYPGGPEEIQKPGGNERTEDGK